LSADTVKAKLLLESDVIFDKHMEFALRGAAQVTDRYRCVSVSYDA
jgi:hypothetical protein